MTPKTQGETVKFVVVENTDKVSQITVNMDESKVSEILQAKLGTETNLHIRDNVGKYVVAVEFNSSSNVTAVGVSEAMTPPWVVKVEGPVTDISQLGVVYDTSNKQFIIPDSVNHKLENGISFTYIGNKDEYRMNYDSDTGWYIRVNNYAPLVDTLHIAGTAQVGSQLTGEYNFNDSDHDSEGTSTYRWLISSDDINYTPISGATNKTYTPVADDLGKYIKFEVTPVDSHGLAGESVTSAATSAVAEESKRYTVTFDSKGGTKVDSVTVDKDQKVTEPTISTEKGVYTFAGWYKDETLTQKWDFANDKVTGNTVLYAKWVTFFNFPSWGTYVGSRFTGVTYDATHNRLDIPEGLVFFTFILDEGDMGFGPHIWEWGVYYGKNGWTLNSGIASLEYNWEIIVDNYQEDGVTYDGNTGKLSHLNPEHVYNVRVHNYLGGSSGNSYFKMSYDQTYQNWVMTPSMYEIN
jgi:uncharacterized repeat protein (TIGR02543 family)